MPLQIRRGTEAERQTLASPLVSGELLWITDDYRLYIGDGNTLAKDLSPVTGYGDDNAKDAAASIFTAGSHSGISFSYDGATAIDATVSYPALLQNLSMNGFDITGTGDITITGSIIATSFTGDYKGSISADDSTILVDALNGSINLSGTVKGDIIPDIPGTYNIGSISSKFNNLYISETGLHLGSVNITSNGSVIDLPIGSTVGGVTIGTTDIIPGSNYNINIVGDDSTVIVDSATNSINASTIFANDINANLTGDVTGSVFADDSSIIIDATNRTFNNGNIVITEGSLTNIANDTITFQDSQLVINSYKDTGTGFLPRIRFEAHRLSGGVPSIVQDGDVIVTIVGTGYTGTDYVAAGSINFVVNDSGISGASTFIRTDTFIGDNFELTSATGNYLKIDKVGVTTAPAFVTGSYTTGNEPTSPVAGMIIFDSTTQKYKGYVDDTGLAGGGLSNSTPGWVDLY